ncbi:histidine kinase dimerization/phospho-acceptor domain-containing protein [Paenibacillus sp. D2_2]|uniref:sensor histidine kinase n=1 Tax=Paenibacillus sp. D2_2 TaxID=3073092 RepID=UPI002814DF4A|nr:histidine kinase dimerization/phospho-acceptor domain-containing protein [Paenibacillus sp. D2_2]WMT38841.1 histidine kinase dimerization/phospho-acceptor domain-containing protein [Paenibacillus sp. D2_2]
MGIQKRLVGSYMVVIFITVLILEIFLIASVRFYYFHNVERILMNQAELSASFFQQYFAEDDLEAQSDRLLKGFSHNSDAQVQIITTSGRLLQDSNGFHGQIKMTQYPDVQTAITGIPGVWKGKDPVTNEPVLAVSYPLQAQEKGSTLGEVRFATSLTTTLHTIHQITILLISVGILVIAIVTILGLLLSRTITRSIKDLKQAANRMTEGDFNVRVHKRYQDELGSLADTLNMMAARILKSEELKNDFISSISHELRTPLTSIKGWVITLKANGRNNQMLVQEGLDIMEAESDRLTHLVDELLDFSKLDNGRISLQFTSVDLEQLIWQIGRQLNPRAVRQGVNLEVQVEEDLPNVSADVNRLKQVFINLLDNSLKYTPHGGSIVVRAYRDEENVIICVEDTG